MQKFTMTNKNVMEKYMADSNMGSNIKNFRLYYQDKETNLVWYDGKIIFIPKEYFELKNLVNVDLEKKCNCSMYLYEFQLIEELQSQDIKFVMDPGLEEFFKRVTGDAIIYPCLDNNVAIESIYNFNYENVVEPIYLGDGNWLNFENKRGE